MGNKPPVTDSADLACNAAACSARPSLLKALKIAWEAISREFSLTYRFSVSDYGTAHCVSIRERWKECGARARAGLKTKGWRAQRRLRRFDALFKGCNRIFDVPCPECDPRQAVSALDKWKERVAGDYAEEEKECSAHLASLKRNVRMLVEGWGARLSEARLESRESGLPDDYTPDRQGCLERTQREGGTLSVPADDQSNDYSLVRVGVAKQKGKLRVVTMQSAYVKRVLTPVHRAIYDFISSFGWCVRGDVTTGDFRAVAQFAGVSGEKIISGDYTAATDNIYLPAVRAVVEVLSEDPRLTAEEKAVLVGSFENLRWTDRLGHEAHPIRRGSMMGNLISFPVLCLLNKSCHDIAANKVYGPTQRTGRFNGDDCLFAGKTEMYDAWRETTRCFGFEVNEEKTEFEHDWADLNSQCFDVKRNNFVSKNVLSFLRPKDNSPGERLTSILQGIDGLRWDVQLWLVNVHARHIVNLKGYSPSGLPSKWVNVLRKRAWFRRAILMERRVVIKTRFEKSSIPTRKDRRWMRPEGCQGAPGRDIHSSRGRYKRVQPELRELPTVIGPPPLPEHMWAIDKLCFDIERAHRDAWRGVRVEAGEPEVDRRLTRQLEKEARKESSACAPRWLGWKIRWGYRYPKMVWDALDLMGGSLLATDEMTVAESYLDSPRLSLQYSYLIMRTPNFYPPPLVDFAFDPTSCLFRAIG